MAASHKLAKSYVMGLHMNFEPFKYIFNCNVPLHLVKFLKAMNNF